MNGGHTESIDPGGDITILLENKKCIQPDRVFSAFIVIVLILVVQ
jgi:hypothetical protein